ncbi:hypothetical protein Cni_G17718 [Canna indica]|uniref:Uncharacterized protein n=1 Tax=Canna indica TaxID=4628 RepID=A0AAQ3KHI2_9LILI|nr:hypothetical protein Cni_G17718 [Canna indica]
MSKRGGTVASRLSRYVKAPMRLLCRVCDSYVRAMTNFAGKMEYGGGAGLGYAPMLPRSFSVHSAGTSTSGDDDFRELVRAASVARMGSLQQLDRVREASSSLPMPRVVAVPRSRSAAIGRIDEDKPCEFGADVRLGEDYLLPRSRSSAVPAKRRFAAFV